VDGRRESSAELAGAIDAAQTDLGVERRPTALARDQNAMDFDYSRVARHDPA
jgi:hypothetical protein